MDFGVDHLRSDRHVGDRTLFGRHTHISPGLQYRRGRERLYGFVTFGPGLAIDTEGSDFSGARLEGTMPGLQAHAKGGFVAALSERLLVRADLFTTFRYVMPDIGVRIGLGYRF